MDCGSFLARRRRVLGDSRAGADSGSGWRRDSGEGSRANRWSGRLRSAGVALVAGWARWPGASRLAGRAWAAASRICWRGVAGCPRSKGWRSGAETGEGFPLLIFGSQILRVAGMPVGIGVRGCGCFGTLVLLAKIFRMSEVGRPCSICAHPERVALDSALIAGESLRDIAGRFAGVARSSLSRHRRGCMADSIAAAADFDARVTAQQLVSDLNKIRVVTLQLLDEARGNEDVGVALRAIARLEHQVELIARLAGELIERRESVEMSILVDAHWLALRERIVRVLQAHPVALMAVLAELAPVERLV